MGLEFTTGHALLLSLWAALNLADAYWIYFFVRATVDPNPHTGVNRTHAGYEAYEAFMFIFGFLWGVVNIFAMKAYYAFSGEWWKYSRFQQSSCMRILYHSWQILVMGPVAIALIVLPFFGGWIIVPIAQSWAWRHRCDSYPMYAILDGKSTSDPSWVVNVAYFFEQGNPNSLYTYEIANPTDADYWTFTLRNWDSPQADIPLNMYPTLQSVGYEFINNTVSGNCTVPVPSPGSANTTTTSCASGTFDDGSLLSFNLTSAIPLNNTSNATVVPRTTTLLRAVDNQWTFSDDPPAVILDQVDPLSNALQQIMLRTAVAKTSDCTELKVCIGGSTGQANTLVGAEVMAPLGMLLMRQADYAIYCTRPSDN